MYKQIFAVAGNPVLHSLSPELFNQEFAKNNIDAVYTRLLADNAAEAISTALKIGISGLNVTSPFKEEVFRLVDEVDDAADLTGAVNTVVFKNGKTSGYNTDWLGVSDSFHQNGIEVSGKKVLILGAGGAASSALYAMFKEKAIVTIVNRTFKKSAALAKKYGVSAVPMEKLPELISNSEIIISTIPGGVNPVPDGLFKPDHIVFDADYHNFAIGASAQRQGSRVIHGSLWLINQARHSFKLFLGKECSNMAIPDPLKMKENIAFTGFMCSGKTSSARELGRFMDRLVVDTDRSIEQDELMTIAEIFEKSGEPVFRKMEKHAVEKACLLKKHIIAFGGGAVLSKENRMLIGQTCLNIWLFADETATLERANKELSKRPLLISGNDMSTLMKSRIPFYAECADLIINSSALSPSKIAEKVIAEINRTFRN